MSTQKGNLARSRPQKYQNTAVYKKDLYGTTPTTKALDAMRIEGLCPRCTHIIEWKIKFKKYKKLTAPGICVKCKGRTVKEAYHTICRPCAKEADKCPKCGDPCKSEKVELAAEKSQTRLSSQSESAVPDEVSRLKSDVSSLALSDSTDDSSDYCDDDESDE